MNRTRVESVLRAARPASRPKPAGRTLAGIWLLHLDGSVVARLMEGVDVVVPRGPAACFVGNSRSSPYGAQLLAPGDALPLFFN